MKPFPVFWIVAATVFSGAGLHAAEKSAGPLKVFILVGQSNMEGKAAASTLEPVIADPKTHDDFKHLKKDGKWAVRDDVWVTFLCKASKGPQEGGPSYGPLTVGFGGQKAGRDENNRRIPVPAIGPELGFGDVVGDHFDEQVLLIKAAWGGKSLRKDFLPPSAGGPGEYYTKTVEEVRKVLDNIKRYFPAYDEKQRYEIAGLVWFQGWNDGVGRGNPEYTEQLADFIRDIRKDLKVPDMPVVIGELGVDGDEPMAWIATFRKQQAAVAEMPEFKDNVRFAKTAQFWPAFQKELDPKWKAFQAKSKAFREQAEKEGRKLTREEIEQFAEKNWRIPNKDQIARISDRRYHYLGCGETYYRIGAAFANAMLELVR